MKEFASHLCTAFDRGLRYVCIVCSKARYQQRLLKAEYVGQFTVRLKKPRLNFSLCCALFVQLIYWETSATINVETFENDKKISY